MSAGTKNIITRVALVYNDPTIIIDYRKEDKDKKKSDVNYDIGDRVISCQRSKLAKNEEDDFHQIINKENTSCYFHRKITFKECFLKSNSIEAEVVATEIQQQIMSILFLDQEDTRSQACFKKLVEAINLLKKHQHSEEQAASFSLIATYNVYDNNNSINTNNTTSSVDLHHKIAKKNTGGDPNNYENVSQELNDDDQSNYSKVESLSDISALDGITNKEEEIEESVAPVAPHIPLFEGEDLNKVSEEDLKEAKEQMNTLFDVNKVTPGKEGYQYDKRVDFVEAISESSWDD